MLQYIRYNHFYIIYVSNEYISIYFIKYMMYSITFIIIYIIYIKY